MGEGLEKGGMDDIIRQYISPVIPPKTPREVVAVLHSEGEKFKEGSDKILEGEKGQFNKLVENWIELKIEKRTLEKTGTVKFQETLEKIATDLKDNFSKIATVDPNRGFDLLLGVKEIIYRQVVMGKYTRNTLTFREEVAQNFFVQFLKDINIAMFYKSLTEGSRSAEGKETELILSFREALDEAIKKIDKWDVKENPSWPPK